MKLQKILRSGQFWMTAWLIFFVAMVFWGILTGLFWMDSVRNVNALSIMANIGMAGAGVQATLAMRKADQNDKF